MSDDGSDYYSSNTESDDESIHNVVLPKKVIKPIEANHAKQFGGYEEDDDIVADDSEPDDADIDDDDDDVDVNPEVTADVDGFDDDTMVGGAESEDDADDSDIDIDDDGEVIEKVPSKNVKQKKTAQLIIDDDEDDEDDDEYDENYLQKFDNEINKNYITEFHPECLNHNSDEIEKLTKVIRDENNIIIDPLHKTLPFLTKYEKARILGQRAKQIEIGSKPLVKVPENIIDGYVIAELELREKKIPFIIKRPIPGGAFEYWHLKDLEDINF